MGYCYDERGRLVCDGCGQAGGVRRRTCPHTVLGDSRHGTRGRLPWCQPPAYCGPCLAARGGTRAAHAACEAGAAQDQAEADQIEAGLEAGGSYVATAWGDWADDVPAGMTGLLLRTRDQAETRILVPAAAYRQGETMWLSDFPGAAPWPPG